MDFLSVQPKELKRWPSFCFVERATFEYDMKANRQIPKLWQKINGQIDQILEDLDKLTQAGGSKQKLARKMSDKQHFSKRHG